MNWVKIKQKLDIRDWHLWFAWVPVVVQTYPDGNEKKVWLETVLRRKNINKRALSIGVLTYDVEYKELPKGRPSFLVKSEWPPQIVSAPMKLQEVPSFLGDDGWEEEEEEIMKEDNKTYLVSAEKAVERSERNQLWAHCEYCAKKVESWPEWKKQSFGEKYNTKGVEKEISPLEESTFNKEVSSARANKTIM